MKNSGSVLILLLVVLLTGLSKHGAAQNYVRRSAPEMFSFEELVRLSKAAELEPDLAAKLHNITTTPFISNEAHYRGAALRRSQTPSVGSTKE